MIRKGLEEGVVEAVKRESLLLQLHDPEHRLDQDAHRDGLVLIEHVRERPQHELSDVIVMDVLNQCKGQEFVYHWRLVVSALSELVQQLEHQTESGQLHGA